ncbi:hypothetical protein IscW_ISCW009023 [Ixodes scapularis]|uniref:Uncharacterized protein n=1 Tax=Ixodes scapularis TaxID=6945 RepID=B7Q373_IXOSC|nr:hypothetical protein IscW_ISCW009023 [Ixodes scapularis]|eukprot:XP_002411171.1 hypothetical protein IscW_ISCW009023 [Ixodes scapularis]
MTRQILGPRETDQLPLAHAEVKSALCNFEVKTITYPEEIAKYSSWSDKVLKKGSADVGVDCA